MKSFPARTKTFESSFFPHCAEAWENLIEELANIASINTFKSSILNVVRPRKNSVFVILVVNGVKRLTRLRFDFSYLNEHKFWHSFNDIINRLCSCDKKPETTLHYLLHCDFYSIYRLEFLNYICALNKSFKNFSEEHLLKVLLYGAEDFTSRMNSEILKYTTKFVKKQIALVALYFFPSFFSLTKYLVLNISYMYFMFNYVQNLQ